MPELKGQIERITYANDENDFTIAKLKVYGEKDLITIVGNLSSVHAGTILKLEGEWVNHPKFGTQFKIKSYITEEPSTEFGIRKYLGSGLIKGLGPVMAKKIVKHFGEDTLDVIESDIHRLKEIEGIGKKRIEMIKEAWDSHKEIRSVMVFLQSHGIGSGFATRIFKRYGNKSIEIVKNNPYSLASDIFGIGFISADKIARNLGFEKSSKERAEAGIIYYLGKCSDNGHVYYPLNLLIEEAEKKLDIERTILEEAAKTLNRQEKIVIEEDERVFLSRFIFCEKSVAEALTRLNIKSNEIRIIEPERAVKWVQNELSINLAEKQIEAVHNAIINKLMVITGGPGTGKTTIINAIIKIYSKIGVRINLAAPTGRAAKRMSEATGHPAKTIHRLLEYSFQEGGFKHNRENPLNCDLLIIDEASMLDIVLMHHLLRAIPLNATLILVGDVNQLPSVGAGNVLNDIIESGVISVVRLNEIFRQASKSQIVVNAHRINSGKIPFINNPSNTDFFFIEKEEPEEILHTIVRVLKERIPKRFGFDPVDDVQVLTPMNRGIIGSFGINEHLQKELNPVGKSVTKSGTCFRVGDKVMQIRNNYDKEVFNGDTGKILNISDNTIDIVFESRIITYDFSDLDEIVLAYAVTVHKSQGSEYPVVILPVTVQHYMLLQRNLIYTGVTRGKKIVIMIGTRKALAIGINNNKTEERFTWLKRRLRDSGNGLPFPDHVEH